LNANERPVRIGFVGRRTCVALVMAAAVTATSTSAASTKWTEFGATKRAWYSAHTPDPNPKLSKGCCFLPRQRDGADQFYGVQYERNGGVPRVFTFTMWFAPAISFAAAKTVARQEAPPGSRLVSSRRHSECFEMTFTSSALSRAFNSKQALMEVYVFSSPNGPFNGRTVMDIIFLSAKTAGC